MILGTHNTMTYKNPKNWYLWPFKWMAQCQSKDYKTQHEKYGANAFDLRLFWDEEGNLEYRHGGFAYDGSDFDELLKYAEDNNIICRILFEERTFPKYLKERAEKNHLKQKFIDTCAWIERTYPNLKCYGGCNTGTWEKLYDFGNVYNDVGYYSSVTSLFNSPNQILKVADDWIPRLYAILKNKENRAKYDELYKDENIIVHYDFIEKN